MLPPYTNAALERADIDTMTGTLLLEFGSNLCGICRATTPLVDAALAALPDLPHMRVQDGKGRRLGRSYGIKLWPTLILLRDGREAGRVVRPQTEAEIAALLAELTGG
jgi:thioredoxin 1